MTAPSNRRCSTNTAIADALERFRDFWFEPTSSRNLAAARIVLSAIALWVVMSRDLPTVLHLPHPMWASVDTGARIRFGIFLPATGERILYAILVVALAAALIGIAPRINALLSGLLLYHFAPMETLIWTPNPYLRGLTISTIGLLILSFTPDIRDASVRRDTPAARWPVLLIQIVICQMYFFAAWAKLTTSGLAWASETNMRRWLLLIESNYGLAGMPLSHQVAAVPGLPSAIGWMGLLFELAFPLVLFSRTARWVLVPAAAAFHLANIALYHIVFQALPALLVFVDWSRPDEGGRL